MIESKLNDAESDHFFVGGPCKAASIPKNCVCLQGSVGFFHPFAECGGGGERVLWYVVEIKKPQYDRHEFPVR